MTDDRPFRDIGARLRAYRELRGMTRAAWVEQHGFNLPQYAHWETGRRRITIDQAAKLERLYGLTLDWIYLGKMHTLSYDLVQLLDDGLRESSDTSARRRK